MVDEQSCEIQLLINQPYLKDNHLLVSLQKEEWRMNMDLRSSGWFMLDQLVICQ